MKKLVIIILCIFLFTSCATPIKWTKEDKIYAGYFLLGHAADMLTTERNLDRDGWYEINPILDKHPSDLKLAFYFSFTTILGLTIAHIFPEYRKALLATYGTVNWGFAISNQIKWNKRK
jgi:hypothetical protein